MRSVKLNADDYAGQLLAALYANGGKAAYEIKRRSMAKLGVKNLRLLSHAVYGIEDRLRKLERKLSEKNSSAKGKRK